jgi:hypothetical protein
MILYFDFLEIQCHDSKMLHVFIVWFFQIDFDELGSLLL